MSFSERCRELEQSFRTTVSLLRELLAGLQARRVAWGSSKPSVVVPSPELERIAQQLAGEETRRTAIVDAIRRMLPAPIAADRRAQHVNVTRIAAALPADAGRSLREAADEATSLAKSVRIEVTFGQRLLQFTQRAQDALLTGHQGLLPRGGASLYDRHARAGRAERGATARGLLIDGRM